MRLAEVLYDWGVEAGRTVLPRAPFLPEKARRSVARREGLIERIETWAAASRGTGPLIWLHAPSVGESLQARPVIEALRELRPELQVFYSFFSPSAEELADRMPADYADYMPFDVTGDLMRAMEALRPDVIVFGKADVWPNVTRVAGWRGVRTALVSATLAPDSSRLRWPARALLGPAYARLDAVGAISEDDAGRLARLGVPRQRIAVTGDARFDQVWRRAQAVDRTQPPLSLLARDDAVTLVAGSTWPECDRRLVPALARLRARHSGLRAVLVPHEPTAEHLGGLEVRLKDAALRHVRLSRVESDRGADSVPDVVVVDRVGVLGVLYALADVAYVGGGFGRQGLHSVLEPAAFGAPVLFGPHHANAREADELIAHGGAAEVCDALSIERVLERWLERGEERTGAGASAQAYVRERLGAARRNAELVLTLLEE